MALVGRGDACGDNDVAGNQRRVEAAGDADADDGAAIRLHARGKHGAQPRGIAAGHDRRHTRPGGEARLNRVKPVTAKTGRPPGANLTFRFPLRGSETDAAVQNVKFSPKFCLLSQHKN